MSYVFRFVLLTIGFALTTFGLLSWQAADFNLRGIWVFDNGYQPHAIHVLILGLAMIPPSIWEIFLLEAKRRRD